MMTKMNTEKWQLIRCIYDYMGMCCDEIEDPDRFVRKVKEGETVNCFIGEIFVHDEENHVKVILEGEKDILEYVLKKMKG